MGGGEHDRAIAVILDLRRRAIADTHRLVTAIAGEIRHLEFAELAAAGDWIERRQMLGTILRESVDDVGDEAEIILHRPRRAEAVQRMHDEIGVAQPAEAVVPVALRTRRLGDRGGQRRDDGPALLEGAELQRDRGTNDLALPFEGDGKRADPVAPVIGGLVEELARGRLDLGAQRLVRADEEGERLLDRERDALQHIGDRRVGGQADGLVCSDEADMVGAAGDLVRHLAETEARLHDDTYARAAGDPPDAADQLRRPKEALIADEARREIEDLQRIAVIVGKHRGEDRGVVEIALLAARHADHLDGEDALFRHRIAILDPIVDQRAEHRVAVEAREAAPDDPGLAVDQRGDGAVADDAEIERGHARRSDGGDSHAYP